MISPISIDLGAKNTGVYSAHYEAGTKITKTTTFEDIGGEGKVYCLEKDKYTLLMTERTKKRHQRRGYTRRKLAKRLFKLIWEKHFNLAWDKDVQQTLSFLMNRRGFSFLAGEYDADTLREFPKEAYEKLPEELKENITQNDNETYDFALALQDWSASGEEANKKYEVINKEPSCIKRELVVISRMEKLQDYCKKRIEGTEISEKKNEKKGLSQLSKWVTDEWKSRGVQGLEGLVAIGNKIDVVSFLNEQTPEQAKQIQSSIKIDRKKKSELKKSIWNFNTEEFDLEKVLEEGKFENKDGNPEVKTHLHHLAFALYKTFSELESGARHRSKYFEEVHSVLKSKKHTHGYLKRFCEKLSKRKYEPLTEDKLKNLIGHVSNFELKPLRKYFNDKKHREGDYWDKDRLAEKFENWILKEWRVNKEKDKLKAEGQSGDYKKLKDSWENRKGSVIDFWLETDPNLTIPPYQDNNNRRPPKCQSLVFNPSFLDKEYKQWESWAKDLKKVSEVKKYLGDYKDQISKLKSGKKKSYFEQPMTGDFKKDSGKRTQKELDARILQFIFDRVKAEDPLKLNEIYSQTKKYRQRQSNDEEKAKAKKELEKAIKESALPEKLKSDRNFLESSVFAKDSFLHLVCRYYKIRQKARDGRVFIHPKYRYVEGRGYENTGHFDSLNHLLTYCNHKPRQKRYQMFYDIASLLQVSRDDLRNVIEKSSGKTENDKLFSWLKSIRGLSSNGKVAAKEQKDRRGNLKSDIEKVFRRIPTEQPESLSKEKIEKAHDDLYNTCKKSEKLLLSLTQNLYSEEKQKEWQSSLKSNPATSVYLLAQIYNLVFKERNGNSKTCPVCSVDNAQRMQIVDNKAKAQRLPAISMRLIDGAVMRMVRILSKAVVEEQWKKVKGKLNDDKKVHIPIIIESNRFEFEPSLKELKKKILKEKDKEYRKSNPVNDKDERIRNAGKSICPYTGKQIPSGEGDKDHIIPRSSSYGTLNDEANLIWSSEEGNRKVKKDKTFYLDNLHEGYKRKLFSSACSKEIEKRIVNPIWAETSKNFKFGKYVSFVNLSEEDQKAFRHALFLNKDHPLREKVIDAISRRTQTLVNGTQRYFAQAIADNFYKKAKKVGLEKRLSFDFFEAEAWTSSKGNGIRELRKDYERSNPEFFGKYKKAEDSKQDPYSHLIDAQLAFIMVADRHRNEGSLKLQIDDSIKIEPWNESTGEISENNLFNKIRIEPSSFKEKKLERKKPSDKFCSHRAFTRDTFYSARYLPIIFQFQGDQPIVKVGFNSESENSAESESDKDQSEKKENSAEIDIKTKKQKKKFLKEIKALLPFLKDAERLQNRKYESLEDLFKSIEEIKDSSKSYYYLTIDRKKLHSYLIENCNTRSNKIFDNHSFVFKTLFYRTEKVSIDSPENLEKNS